MPAKFGNRSAASSKVVGSSASQLKTRGAVSNASPKESRFPFSAAVFVVGAGCAFWLRWSDAQTAAGSKEVHADTGRSTPAFTQTAASTVCTEFHGKVGGGTLRDLMAGGQPTVVSIKELTSKGSFWDILPDDALFNFSVSPVDGFYNLIPDPTSHIGLRRICPARLAGASWGLLREIMQFQLHASNTTDIVVPEHLQAVKLMNEDDPLGDGLVPLKTALEKRYRLYLSGESSDEVWEPKSKKLQQIAKRMRHAMSRDWETQNIWLSAGSTMSNLHFDGGDNWLCQLSGVKHATMFASEDSEALYPVVFDRPGDPDYRQVLRDNGAVEEISIPMENRDIKAYAAVKEHDPDIVSFPKFPQARRVTCRVGPGQCLGIPHHWWHNIRSEEGEINLSVNFGFGPASEGWSPEMIREMELMELVLSSRQHLLRNKQSIGSRNE